jgi:hypothetical protein
VTYKFFAVLRDGVHHGSQALVVAEVALAAAHLLQLLPQHEVSLHQTLAFHLDEPPQPDLVAVTHQHLKTND